MEFSTFNFFKKNIYKSVENHSHDLTTWDTGIGQDIPVEATKFIIIHIRVKKL